jgi:M6 family metalloprotease-like protein
MKKLLAVILAMVLIASAGAAVAAPAKKAAYKPKGFAYDRCGYENGLKGTAAQLQNYLLQNRRCVGAMKILESALVKEKPKTSSSLNGVLNVELCRLKHSESEKVRAWKGFPSQSQTQDFEDNRVPAPGKVIQIIPIYSSDAPKSGKSPYQDYKYYIDAARQYFNYINDGPDKVIVNVLNEYILFPKPIAPYGVTHGKDDAKSLEFIQDAVTAVDEKIDFTESDFRLFVVPAGTPSAIISEQGFPFAKSNEGFISNLAIAQPINFRFAPDNTVGAELGSLEMFFHEFYHPGMNLGDNHGTNSSEYDENRGMGQFGLMSSGNGDLLAWQKWFLGFTEDSQIRCVDKNQPSTNWIAPSSVKTKMAKIVVIPITKTKSLVIESIRAKGLSYRYPTVSLGALVYEVDIADTRHEYGYKVFYPDSRRPNSGSRYPMEDAPLKLGESLTYEGVKITNVEWGEFGDVIKVEPVK